MAHGAESVGRISLMLKDGEKEDPVFDSILALQAHVCHRSLKVLTGNRSHRSIFFTNVVRKSAPDFPAPRPQLAALPSEQPRP